MIKEITVKGKTFPVKISYYALSRLQLETGQTPEDITLNMSLLEPLFYYAIEAGCKETGQVFELKREDVPFILDDVYVDFVKIFTDFFPSSETPAVKKKNN